MSTTHPNGYLHYHGEICQEGHYNDGKPTLYCRRCDVFWDLATLRANNGRDGGGDVHYLPPEKASK